MAHAHKPLEKFGVQAEKARVILVFRNGDKHHAGEQITMNMKRFKTYDQLKAEMSRVVKGFTGPIRTVRTPHGQLVKSMDEFVDGGMYVACGAEPLNKASLPEALVKMAAAPAPAHVEHEAPAEEEAPAEAEEAAAPEEQEAQEEEQAEAEPAAPSPAASTGTPTKLQKFGVQTEKGRIVILYRNGDKHHKGERLVVHPKKYKNWDQFLAACAIVKGFTGAIRKVVLPNGHRLSSVEEIEDGGSYICCGAEPLSTDKLPEALTKP